jgi:hypothetical protein
MRRDARATNDDTFTVEVVANVVAKRGHDSIRIDHRPDAAYTLGRVALRTDPPT